MTRRCKDSLISKSSSHRPMLHNRCTSESHAEMLETTMLVAHAWALPIAATCLSIVLVTLATTHLPRLLRRGARKLRSVVNSAAVRAAVARSPSKDAAAPSPAVAVSKELDFPADWWTSTRQYELERRAIFSKTWLLVGHRAQFARAGDYRTCELAGFNVVLVLGKDGRLRGFHNVCRHRAYTVCTKAAGNSSIMRCRYHGWTYDSTGRLVKAPKFDEVSGFDKRQNGLFEVRNWIDSSGFVYLNLDVYGSDGLTIRVGVPISARLKGVHNWTVPAHFNWKIAMPTGSFKVRSLATQNRLLSYALSFESWKWPAEFELSPLTRLLRSTKGDMFLTISVVPTGARSCNIVCHLYCPRSTARTDYPVSSVQDDILESVRNLQAIFDHVSHSGAIPDLQSQEPLLAEIQAHSRLERLMGAPVYPASRMRETSRACKVADDLCKELEANMDNTNMSVGVGDGLAW